MLSYATKVIGLVIALAGLLLGLANLLGAFSHPERMTIVELIRSSGSVPAELPAFSQVLKRFPPPNGCARQDINALAPTTSIRSGGRNMPIGPLRYSGCPGSPPVGSFDSLVAWAAETSYPWAAWLISLCGWLIVLAGVLAEKRERAA